MPEIVITLRGDNITTASIGWFVDAINGASGHSGRDYPVVINNVGMTVNVPAEED